MVRAGRGNQTLVGIMLSVLPLVSVSSRHRPADSLLSRSLYATVIVIFSDTTGGSKERWFWSARRSCRMK